MIINQTINGLYNCKQLKKLKNVDTVKHNLINYYLVLVDQYIFFYYRLNIVMKYVKNNILVNTIKNVELKEKQSKKKKIN